MDERNPATMTQARPPDLLVTNAVVLTADPHDRRAEAVSVTDGRISGVGSADTLGAGVGPSTTVVDVAGATVVPGFVDPHSHVSMAAPFVRHAALHTPPVGDLRTVDDVIERLAATRDRLGPVAGDWLVGWGWFPDRMEDGGRLAADVLDRHFPDLRVAVAHVSVHGGVVNGRVLAERGVVAGAPDPAGGTVVRWPGTDIPSGELWEAAWLPILFGLPPVGAPEIDAMLREYARWGYTTAQDGAATWSTVARSRRIASKRALPIDLVSLVVYTDADEAFADRTLRWGEWEHRHKVQGIKLILDGSPQGRTAHLTKPYRTRGPGGEASWCGVEVMDRGSVGELVERAYRAGVQVFAHVNGDAAIDSLLAAHRSAVVAGAPYPGRTVPIHSQVVRLDQLEGYAAAGFAPSMFTMHTHLFGDVHLEHLGATRASGISPMRSAIELGLRPTNHSDHPITPLDPMWLLWSSVSRTSIDGEVLGPRERITPTEGLRALTIDAAWEHFDEDDRGSIERGKLGDLVVLDADPTAVPVEAIRDIRVLRTIKRGETVYEA